MINDIYFIVVWLPHPLKRWKNMAFDILVVVSNSHGSSQFPQRSQILNIQRRMKILREKKICGVTIILMVIVCIKSDSLSLYKSAFECCFSITFCFLPKNMSMAHLDVWNFLGWTCNFFLQINLIQSICLTFGIFDNCLHFVIELKSPTSTEQILSKKEMPWLH